MNYLSYLMYDRNEDVTKTSYSAMLDLLHVNDNDSSLTEEKVDKLCDSFMTHMQEIDSNRLVHLLDHMIGYYMLYILQLVGYNWLVVSCQFK